MKMVSNSANEGKGGQSATAGRLRFASAEKGAAIARRLAQLSSWSASDTTTSPMHNCNSDLPLLPLPCQCVTVSLS